MTLKSNFNYHPAKRAKTNRDAAYTNEGVPLYSERRTPGTAKADEVLGTRVEGKKVVRTAPMPTPPRRFNGPLSRIR